MRWDLACFAFLLVNENEARRGGGSRGGGGRGNSNRGSSNRGTSNWGSSRNTGWSNGKPTYSSSATYSRSNMKYPSGGSSWSKPSSKMSLGSMSANPNYRSYSNSWKKKSSLSTAKNVALLAGGAYVGYKLGKAVGSLGAYGHYNMMPYHYGPYYGGYQPYYAQPFMFSGQNYNRYAYRTQSCYECSSVDGSNPMCEYMDDKYAFSDLDGFRHVCPTESYCAVTVGRVYPDVPGPPPSIPQNGSDPIDNDTFKKYEGKDFVRRVCQPIRRQQEQKCDYCPTPIPGQPMKESCDIFICNVCDTESCNSWGTSSMPDKRMYSSAYANYQSAFLLLTVTVLHVFKFA